MRRKFHQVELKYEELDPFYFQATMLIKLIKVVNIPNHKVIMGENYNPSGAVVTSALMWLNEIIGVFRLFCFITEMLDWNNPGNYEFITLLKQTLRQQVKSLLTWREASDLIRKMTEMWLHAVHQFTLFSDLKSFCFRCHWNTGWKLTSFTCCRSVMKNVNSIISKK